MQRTAAHTATPILYDSAPKVFPTACMPPVARRLPALRVAGATGPSTIEDVGEVLAEPKKRSRRGRTVVAIEFGCLQRAGEEPRPQPDHPKRSTSYREPDGAGDDGAVAHADQNRQVVRLRKGEGAEEQTCCRCGCML